MTIGSATGKPFKVMVLAGGPDRERPVSLLSGAEVSSGLQEAGYEVIQRDIGPDKLEALDEFEKWGGQVVFPALHGSWGEGGPLQKELEKRNLHFVGCQAEVAERCMNKIRTKTIWAEKGLPTPHWEMVERGGRLSLPVPAVIKPPCEGSSIDVAICHDAEQLKEAFGRLSKVHHQLLVEEFITGKELTVGIIGEQDSVTSESGSSGGRLSELQGKRGKKVWSLPVIEIVPATSFYDYQAKYQREDTQYRFEIDLPAAVLKEVSDLAVKAYACLGCRHLSRVDVMVDKQNRPWLLEVNTMPGFTSHSLLPKAAAKAGISFSQLVDRLVRLAAAEHVGEPAGSGKR
ncbi:MAG: D-alanine--D-alanine ligase [Phycisphaeraceae bacterium]|nr:D-alanine--D-alanine ligase [Phycisphaeraceae bacterium]